MNDRLEEWKFEISRMERAVEVSGGELKLPYTAACLREAISEIERLRESLTAQRAISQAAIQANSKLASKADVLDKVVRMFSDFPSDRGMPSDFFWECLLDAGIEPEEIERMTHE